MWSANEAHLKLFNEIAAEYKQDPPRRHRDHVRPDPVRELHHHADHPDRRRQRARPGLDPGELGAGLRLLRRAGAARRHAGEDRGLRVDDLAPAATKLWQAGRQAVRVPVLHLAVRRVRQHRPAQGGRAADPGRADRRRRVDLGRRRSRPRRRSTPRPARPAWWSATSTTRRWDNLSTVWTGWGAEAWSADGKTCGFDQQPMVDAMTFLHKAIFTDKAMPGPGTTADFFAGERP